MTKKFNIPAYEYSRNYHYYKSENMPGGSPSFKIKFKLTDYNVGEKVNESNKNKTFNSFDYRRSTAANKDDGLFAIIEIVVILLVIVLNVGLYVWVAVMAQNRNRSVVLWVLLSLLATPLLTIIILLAVGKNQNNIDNRYNRE